MSLHIIVDENTIQKVVCARSDIIDFDTGSVITGEESIDEVAENLFELIIKTASGEYVSKAERLGQDDFIPWKRGVSL